MTIILTIFAAMFILILFFAGIEKVDKLIERKSRPTCEHKLKKGWTENKGGN